MNLLEQLNTLSSEKMWEGFLSLCKDSKKVQHEVLMNILEINQNSEFGKKFSFSSIDTYKKFCSNIPITHWEDYEKAAARMEKGQNDILFSGKTEYFIITSGTSGKEKLIPESLPGKAAKGLTGKLRNYVLSSSFPELFLGKFLPLSNSDLFGVTSGGIPYGFASGITTSNISEKFKKYNACPQVVKQIEDQKISDYAIMRFAMEQDVRLISGNNAARLTALFDSAENNFVNICSDIEHGTLFFSDSISKKIMQDLEPLLKPNPEKADELRNKHERSEKITPELYWPNLKVIRCWMSGSVGRYISKIKPLLTNNIHFYDAGYGASEGKFNVPYKKDLSSGPLTLYSGFYEFIPVDESEAETPEPLLAHQLQTGHMYKLILTSYSGLYRYDMKDIVKVDGFTENTPDIVFVSKTADIGNICGEKLTTGLLQKACEISAEQFDLSLVHICAVASNENSCYHFLIETDDQKLINVNKFSSTIDKYLIENAIGYKILRNQGFIKTAKVHQMREGWQKALYTEKFKPGISLSQIKLPFIYDRIPLAEYEI